MRYSFITKRPMGHFPHTIDDHLYFASEIPASALSEEELHNRPDAFKAFVFSVAFRKGGNYYAARILMITH